MSFDEMINKKKMKINKKWSENKVNVCNSFKNTQM